MAEVEVRLPRGINHPEEGMAITKLAAEVMTLTGDLNLWIIGDELFDSFRYGIRVANMPGIEPRVLIDQFVGSLDTAPKSHTETTANLADLVSKKTIVARWKDWKFNSMSIQGMQHPFRHI